MPGLRDRLRKGRGSRSGSAFAMRDNDTGNAWQQPEQNSGNWNPEGLQERKASRENRLKQYQDDRREQWLADQQSRSDNTVNALRQSENNPQEAQSDQPSSLDDLTNKENSQLNYKTPEKQSRRFSRNGKKKKSKLSSNMRKMMAGALIPLIIIGGGIGLSAMSSFSSAIQFIIVSKLIKETTDFVSDTLEAGRKSVTAWRMVRYLNTGDQSYNAFARSRLGIAGNMMAKSYDKGLKSQGITVRGSATGRFAGFDIDAKEHFGLPDDAGVLNNDDLMNKRGESLKKEMGLDADTKINYDAKTGKYSVELPKDASYRSKKRQLKSVTKYMNKNKRGLRKVVSALKARKLRIRSGVAGFHPFAGLRDKIIDYRIDKRKQRAEEKAKKEQERKFREKHNLGDADDIPDNLKGDYDNAIKNAVDQADEAVEKAAAKVGKVLGKAAKVGSALAILDLICMVNDLETGFGKDKQERVVNPAENVTVEYYSTASQLQNSNDAETGNDDVTMEELGQLSEEKLFRAVEVGEVNDDGSIKGTGDYEYSSWYNSPPVQAMLGQDYIANENGVPEGVPGQLLSQKGKQGILSLLPDWAQSTMSFLFDNSVTSAACDVYNGTVGKVMGWISEQAMKLIKLAVSEEQLAKLAAFLVDLAYGEELETIGVTPQDAVSIAMYGGKYIDNENCTAMGCRPLDKQETARVNREHQEELALEWQEKPLMERLFDKTDYRSAIVQLAVKSQWDMSDESVGTRLANVGKTVAATPTLIASALRNLSPANAKVVNINEDGAYNFGVKTWGYTEEEEDEMLNNMDHDIVKNTAYLSGKYFGFGLSEGDPDLTPDKKAKRDQFFALGTNGGDFNNRMNKCFGVTVYGDGRVTTVNNKDARYYNFFDTDFGDCYDFDDAFQWRLYLMDYGATMSEAIANYGDGEDDENGEAYDVVKQACEDMDVCQSGGGSNSNTSGSNFAGDISGDEQALAKAIIDSGKLQNTSGTDIVGQIKAIADGSVVQGTNGPCYYHKGILQVLKIATDIFDSVGLSSGNRYCINDTTSYHDHWLDGGSWAMDFTSFDGQPTNGQDANAIKLLDAVHSRIQDGQPYGFGQATCKENTSIKRSKSYPKATEFPDWCNHLHIDVQREFDNGTRHYLK